MSLDKSMASVNRYTMVLKITLKFNLKIHYLENEFLNTSVKSWIKSFYIYDLYHINQ